MSPPSEPHATTARRIATPARVLLVDDDLGSLVALESVLDGLDIQKVRARSAQEALRELLNGDFALILLDVLMSDMDGFEVAELIRRQRRLRDLPIIFVTALESGAEQMERAYALGAVDFLSKPVSAEALRSKVQIFVELYRSRHELEVRVAERTAELENEVAHRSRIAAELRLAQEATAHRAAIVDSSDDAIVSKTLDGVVTTWNRGAERIFGYAASEMIGKSITRIIPDDHMAEEKEILSRIIRGERVDHFETIRRRKDGSLVDISLTISPIRDSDGRIVGASKIARDITQEKRAREAVRNLNVVLEERVRERTRSLEETVRELDSFAYTVAHDLRAPLRAIHSFGQMLLEEGAERLDATGVEYIKEMIRAGSRMDTLISDLLAYSRISRQEIPLDSLDLEVVVDRVLGDMDLELSGRKAEVRVDRPLGRAKGHGVLLGQAITNLVSNAAKFVPEARNPVVRIRSERRKAGRVRLWIEDNGIGIAAEHLGRLFKVFERLHARDTYPGTGIGLAIVRRALERMGGGSGVESTPGEGSRFWIELESAPQP
jgi:PAS domain S-box-containing protein